MRDLVHGAHVDIGRQHVVDLASQNLRRERRVQLEVRDLGQRMDAGVGPARAGELEIAASRMARSISPWTVRAFFWICQPL
jgi:hypothetical protein